MMIYFENKPYTSNEEADFEYRAHNSDGWSMTEPDNWVSSIVVDDNGKHFKAWWYVADPETDLDSCDIDWEHPTDLEPCSYLDNEED